MVIGQTPALEDGKLRLEGRPGDPVHIVGEKVVVVKEEDVGRLWTFGEIGVHLEGHNGIGVVITKVKPDGPAAKAGLQPGQVITEVDGTRLEDLTASKARSLLDGTAGSAVRLEVMDPKDHHKTVVVHLIRKAIPAPKLPPGPRDPNIAFMNAIKGQQIQGLEKLNNVKLEPVAQFSPIDVGAEEAIREALTEAGMAFSITKEGDMSSVCAQGWNMFTAKEVLQKVRAQGHWSVATVSTKDGKVTVDAP
jgi:membrane-associated protease RseP (regulator of RpoE activity)